MKLMIAMKGQGGHVELTFENDKARLEWLKTNLQERAALQTLVKDAIKNGYKALQGVKELTDIEDDLFDKKGEISLQGGDGKILKVVAKNLIEAEISSGKMVFEYNSETRTWDLLTAGEFKVKEEEQKVTSKEPVSGG